MVLNKFFLFFLNRWIINTKYYTADVALWMAHLHEGFSIGSLPFYNKLTALVMVFDLVMLVL
jgi:hypothetical protein